MPYLGNLCFVSGAWYALDMEGSGDIVVQYFLVYDYGDMTWKRRGIQMLFWGGVV